MLLFPAIVNTDGGLYDKKLCSMLKEYADAKPAEKGPYWANVSAALTHLSAIHNDQVAICTAVSRGLLKVFQVGTSLSKTSDDSSMVMLRLDP